MKKIFGLVAVALILTTATFAQVLPKVTVENSLSGAFGLPMADKKNDNREGLRFYGFHETAQARAEIGKLTIDGMINWGARTYHKLNEKGEVKYDHFSFLNTEVTPYYYTNNDWQGGYWTNGLTPSYYVNFVWQPVEGLDLGMGTRLNWSVGPAPAANGYFWEPVTHVIQGGLKDSLPGSSDIAGYTYYANNYTSCYAFNTRSSLALRYKYKDIVEVGAALPDGTNSNAFGFNAGLMVHPVDMLTLAVAADGIGHDNFDLYSGATLNFNVVVLDAWVGYNKRAEFTDSYRRNVNGSRLGTGAALTININDIGMTIRPETSFTFYSYDDFAPAWYVGGRLDWMLGDMFRLGAWSSFSTGSSDKAWYNKDKYPLSYEKTKNYVAGHIFDIRPDLTIFINKNHSLTAFFDYQNRVNYTNTERDGWASGLYWTYKR